MCIYIGVSYFCIVIDHVEQGRKEAPEPVPVEYANPEQDQGKPGASNHYTWVWFIFISYLWFLIVH
jgi:hypothetical protein